MVLALPVLVALAVGLVLGGSILSLTSLRLRHGWLFFAAIGLQVVAFPFPFLPWTTPDAVARAIWLVSYATLGVAAVLNARIPGVLVVAAGMLSNVIAIVSNGGHMPSLPSAVRAAGSYTVEYNSKLDASPNAAWLVDRWAMPTWIPGGNVFSVGDVIIGVGALLVVLAAMRPFRHHARRDPIAAFVDRLSTADAAAVAAAMCAVARGGPHVAPLVDDRIHELLVPAEERTLSLLYAESGPDRQVLLAIEDATTTPSGARHAVAERRLADWDATRRDRPGRAPGRDFLASVIRRRSERDPSFGRLLDVVPGDGRPRLAGPASR